MSRWFRLYDALLDAPEIQRMPAAEFGRKFYAALHGDENEFSAYIVGPFVRPPSHEWALIRAEIFERDNYTCTYCGERAGKLQCDHIVPVAKGGTHDLDNLTTACEPCNRSKAAKSLEGWQQ